MILRRDCQRRMKGLSPKGTDPKTMRRHYSINSNNQLFIKPPKQKVSIPVRGRFSIDKNNQLIYWLNEPASWRRLYNLPSKVSFIGNWKLNSNYDLELNLGETKSQYKGERLILKGEIISTDSDTLTFEIITHKQGLSPSELSRSRFKGTVPEATHIQIIKLTGSWQADEFNRIIFMIKKKASPDVITLEGSWQINQNQQITYTYEKTDLKTKSKISNTLTFQGFWQLGSANKLTYIFKHSSDSKFDFRAQIETPTIYPQKGVIKYRLGIGIREERPTKEKLISLYGAWKFSRQLGLVFQMDYGEGEIKQIEFSADISVTQRNEIIFSLKDTKGEPLGLDITFTHSFLNKLDAETFLRLKDFLDKKEAAIEAGVRIPF